MKKLQVWTINGQGVYMMAGLTWELLWLATKSQPKKLNVSPKAGSHTQNSEITEESRTTSTLRTTLCICICVYIGIQDVVRRYDGDVCLLGDSGYGITPWLLSPLLTNQEMLVSGITIRSMLRKRVIIERVFGQMKRRFPTLLSQVRIAVKNVPNLVITCAVLHNVAKHLNDAWEVEDGIENGVAEENVPLYNLDRNEVINRRRGQTKRLEISNNLMM
ncbi:hypothetical protein WA026_005341 [Henosepilachna vigintioctopunctata]|uniref:DDE Tnp4 domain-containing protein n=1 Tax=Henosepilachna vigintioctopunctata TaxID=420089 RepID=A0AAW1UTL2_9CUCU